MAEQDLQIVAKLQDLMSGPLRQIQTQVDALTKAVAEQNRATGQLQANEQAVARALGETTKALVGQAQAQKRSTDEAKKASDQSKKLALDQRELAGAAGDVARNLGLNVGPLAAIASAAGPLAATVAVVVGLSEALAGVIEKTKQINTALAGIGGRATTGQIEQFRQDVLNLSNSTGIAAEQIADGVASIFQNTTARSREAVNELLKQSVLLSKVGFGSVGEAAKALDGVLGALNLRVEESARAAAVLSTSADRAGVPIATFAQALEQSGPLARQFGLSLEDLSALLVSVKSQGIGLGDASNAIRGLLTIFSEEGNATRKALEGIGVNFKGASRDGKGFADVLGQIAERTRGQPELLNALFPGGSQQLTRIFAAVEGASANFRTELERTGEAAKNFEQQVQDSTANAAGFFTRFFNEAGNSASSFWQQFADTAAIGIADLTGNLDLAEAELKRAAERLGLSVDFRSSPVLEKIGKDLKESLREAIEKQDIEAALRIKVNAQETAKFLQAQTRDLASALSASALADELYGEIDAEQLKSSLLFRSLELTSADAEIIADRLQKAYSSAFAKLNVSEKAGSAVGRAKISEALGTALLASIKGLDRLPGEIEKLTAQANAELAKLGKGADGKPIIGQIAAPETAAQVRQLVSSIAEATSLLTAETEALALKITQDAIPAQQKQFQLIDQQAAQIAALRDQYAAEGRDIAELNRALELLAQKRKEVAGITAAQRDSTATIAADLAPFLQAAKIAAQLGVEAQLEVDANQAKLEARKAREDIEKYLREELSAERAGGAAALQIVLQPQLAFDQEAIDRLTVEALIPLGERLNELQGEFESGAISAQEFNAALGQIRSEGLAIQAQVQSEVGFVGSLSASFEDLKRQLADTQQQAAGFAADLTQGLTSAFEGLFQNIARGKASLRDFGAVILQVITQAIARLAALQTASAFLNIFSGGAAAGGGGIGPGVDGVPLGAVARGGIIPGHMVEAKSMTNDTASRWRQIGSALKAGSPVRSYARGGVADRPQVAVFGEGGAEAFVPLPGPNRGIPVEFKSQPRRERGGDSAPSTQVALTLNVGSLDPRTAADVVLAQMPQIQAAITQAIQAGRDRALLSAVRGAMR